ncbi:hypothetical protein Dvina_33190 [Dactylosporangium vinaceum]|uniref:DUF58 domain-containing protein n=1 Tax=Dactylosporangium vinaceum TaxID=53362 RepID=A0ABV5MA33_9ACTN|nr:hypothetical protein [Dactylosporangium vinaceum]UAB93132.1 hypothetical protein Dvina_33190 [Dactylosporangium vinaceum]
MMVSWDLRSRDLPLPATSIVDGAPDAAPVRLRINAGRSGWWTVRVAVPLTEGQARRMRPFDRLTVVNVVLSWIGFALVAGTVISELTGGPVTITGALPVIAGLALVSLVLQVGAVRARPKQYPQGQSGRVEVRDVDRRTALEWQRITDGAVAVER